MVFSLKNHNFKKSISLEGLFAPITRKSVIATDDKRPHNIQQIERKSVAQIPIYLLLRIGSCEWEATPLHHLPKLTLVG